MSNKNIGTLLVISAFAIILGLVINRHELWFFIDLAVIIICLFSGFVLLRKR